MKKVIVLILLMLSSRAMPFVTDYTIHGPMKGWAIKPGKEHFYISTFYQYLSTQNAFHAGGENLSLKDYFGVADANPVLTQSILTADVSLGLTPFLGVQVIAPVIAEYRIHANAGPADKDLVSPRGIGDIDLGLWFVPKFLQDWGVIFSGMYHIMSGTSPYIVAVSDNGFATSQPLATGLGYSYLSFAARADMTMASWLSASMLLDYRHNHYYIQDGYEPTSKFGDVVTCGARVLTHTNAFAMSLAVQVTRSFDDIEQGFYKRGSAFSLLTLQPRVAVLAPKIKFVDSIFLGYVAPISGKNQILADYLSVGVDFQF